MRNRCYPMTFTPVLKNYIWGGRNLENKLGRTLPDGIIAESWEIAGHPNGTSVVENGDYAGKLLTEVHSELGLDLIGTRCAWSQKRNKFPLLIKLLDAHENLSIQVHPDDAFALKNEGNELGKTEMWVVLHAEENARVILGVKRNTTAEAFRQAIFNGNLEKYLHELPVKAGDHICVPAGSLHAIMGGLLIAEIQQNSNTTYRVYDWNRVDSNGKSRPLHIDKALAVTNFEQVEPNLVTPVELDSGEGVRRFQLCKNRYFTVERLAMTANSGYEGRCDGATFEIWGVISGHAQVGGAEETASLPAVKFCLLPAAIGEFSVQALQESVLLRAYVGG